MTTRRGLFVGLAGFVACAPAIVRASSIMPVRAFARNHFNTVPIGMACDAETARIVKERMLLGELNARFDAMCVHRTQFHEMWGELADVYAEEMRAA